MIKISYDKESELHWLLSVLGAGALNTTDAYKFKFLGIDPRQNITFQATDKYVNDIKHKQDEFNKRFEGLTMKEINKILSKELNE